MARDLPRQLVAAAALLALGVLAVVTTGATAAGAASPELVRYGFDDAVETGPDTLQVFQNARGSVRISSEFRLDGYRSVEIRDFAGDGDFPELLGRFPIRTEGRLRAHFGFLVTDPEQAWNVALAGPEGFALRKDGIGFWLQGREGALFHVSDSIPKRLLSLRAFVWYVVDVAYDVRAGSYDLSIREEGSDEPTVALTAQPNAAAQPGSSVSVFSFIGDQGLDESEVAYYVDQIVLTADRAVEAAPFVAPGRRKLFVDAWSEHRKRMAGKPLCFPVSDLAIDLGLDAADLAVPAGSEGARVLEAALDPRGPRRPTRVRGTLPAPLAAVAAWAEGCGALRASKLDQALTSFTRAESIWPKARIYPLSRALALGRAGRADEADRVLASIAGLDPGDPRPTIARALAGIAADDLETARNVLAPSAEALAAELDAGAQRLAEQYFLVLLWNGAFADALRFAAGVRTRLHEARLPTAAWSERVGDASFFLGDAARARSAYGEALDHGGGSALLYEKLADAAFRLGDLEQERVWREKVYGSLR